MSYAVLKAAGYVLVHTPDMVIHNGTTQTVEKQTNPDSEYLKKVPNHLRSFEEVVQYVPNQVYIGNATPDELGKIEKPWVDKKIDNADRFGKFGEVMPQNEFYALLKSSDVFDLVKFEKSFLESVKNDYSKHKLATEEELNDLNNGIDFDEIEKLVKESGSEGIYNGGKLVGCVKKAHDLDVNLNAHVMFENLVVKASGVLAFKHLLALNNIDPKSIDYVIECSEEACGDMNQRGGGNFAKAIAEKAGCVNATGSDMRGFCAGPIHAVIAAASLVKAGTYDNVVVVAGGATAKLGMNGKDHVKKDLPILEDVLGGFAILISKNDGISPIIRNDLVGKHNVGTGSSPQAVIQSLVTAPLDKANLKIVDVDRYSVEMQNPDITKPAGAGDVPEANYKMIAAIGVKRKELERKDILTFAGKHGMQGWAPTQGHIPSGIPYIGFALDDLTSGNLNRAMLVGKGSLFLGRMTNLFDGVSVIIERNEGLSEENSSNISKSEINKMIAEAMKGFAAQLLSE
ncbi:glycine/sarcosine/betaine reductase complex component C subunit beta [Helicovermis profundi]|uniref:Glycine/sarcosine/betaine reductase complex component C subunit beta n=1 Tax=Helicovermis profundi TaxID=3065157 RepID=A0AAU9E2B0_9FIRM|nr:glycine/sarcosine/betaine reductase complex component C subunit beta [Clostridia bacterium S502]